MATYDLEEQEQIDELRTWWRMHGARVTSVITICAVAVAGWQAWRYWQRAKSADASRIFAELSVAAEQRNLRQVKTLTGTLLSDFSQTDYAGLAALVAARAFADSGDEKSASAQLQWASESARDELVRGLAGLRLAGLSDGTNAPAAASSPSIDESNRALWARRKEVLANSASIAGNSTTAATELDAAIHALRSDESNQKKSSDGYRQILVSRLDDLQAKVDAGAGAK